MFEDAAEFNDTNFIPRRVAQEALEEYHKHIKYKGNDLILDVGSGSGNVTSQILVPFIPKSNFHLVGVDILERMVDFSNENVKDPRLTFRVLDIKERDENKLKSAFTEEELRLGFSVVFSFYCLHWTQDYPQSYKNIFSLMRPGGQLFTLNMGKSTLCDIWGIVYKLDRWQQYLKNIPAFKFPYQDSEDPVKECTDMLKEIGFTDIICYHEPKEMVPKDQNLPMRRIMHYLDPHMHLIPKHLHAEYLDDIMKLYETMPEVPHNRLILIATKPHKS